MDEKENQQVVIEVPGEVTTDAKGRVVAIIEGAELSSEQERAILDGAEGAVIEE